MPCCCAVNCTNRSEIGIRLFPLPQGERNTERRKLWIRNIGRENLPKNVYVCQNHFDEDQFEQNRQDGKKLLRWNAVPTLFEHRKIIKSRKPPLKRIYLDNNTANNSDNNQEAIVVTDNNETISEDSGSENEDEEKRELKRKIKSLQKKNSQLEKQMQDYKNNISALYNSDQIAFLRSNSMKGFAWSDETVNKALRLYMACGRSGYEEVRKQNPYPCIRTLQKRIAKFKFTPGCLDDILHLLKAKVECLKPEERYATLLVDEMAISPGLEYDTSISEVIGKPTMLLSGGKSNCEILATHALVFMLAGVTTRWKQTVAYEFTGPSYDAKEMKTKIFSLIQKCSNIGISVQAVVSDMGPQNRSLMRLCNIVATRHGEVINFCKHPCNDGQLYFVCDAPHILKNVRNALTEGQTFYINDSIVQEYNLPSNIVTIDAVKLVVDCDANVDLKIAPYLKECFLNPSHFDKMNVSSALKVLNHDVAAGIKYCILKNKIEEKHFTTAWFIEKLFKWFSMMTARNEKLALSISNQELLSDNLKFLKEFIHIVRNVRVGQRGAWKPFQCGILLTTQSAIDLQKFYVNSGNFKYVLLGRLTQDALENLFSIVRSRSPTPGPREFKVALRLITLSQYEFKPKHGSYAVADSEYLVKYMSNSEVVKETHDQHSEIIELNISLDFSSHEQLNYDEQQSLYYLVGYVLHNIKKKFVTCESCLSQLMTNSDDVSVKHVNSLTQLKEYKPGNLILPSLSMYEFFLKVELFFRRNEKRLLKNEIKLSSMSSLILKSAMSSSVFNIPNCHETLHKAIQIFLKTRLYVLLKKFNAQNIPVCDGRSSRSIQMRIDVG